MSAETSIRGRAQSTLRTKLLVLIAVALAPALILIVLSGSEQRRRARLDAQADALRVARLASARHEVHIESARQLLVTLAQVPELRGSKPGPANSLLDRLRQSHPLYANIGLIAADGDLRYSAVPVPEGRAVFLGDRLYFRRACDFCELSLLNRLGEMLQACHSVPEAQGVLRQLAPDFFPDDDGGIYEISSSRNLVEAAAAWGTVQPTIPPEDCWALRRGQAHVAGIACPHAGGAGTSICIPMLAQGEALGLLHLRPRAPSDDWAESRMRLALAMAEQVGLALANLRLRERLRDQSVRDPLTGLFNRRYLEETLEREVRRADRAKHEVGVLLLDIDHFKRFNDTFGHDAGDLVLQELGRRLRESLRGSDVVTRYGGEEFLLLLPESGLEETRARAEEIREDVKRMHLTLREQPLGPVAVSLGVAAFPSSGATGQAVIQAADAALYRAKREGRDRVIVASLESRQEIP